MSQGVVAALGRGTVLVIAVGMAVVSIGGTSLASEFPGLTPASAPVARAVIADAAPGAKVKCMTVRITKSSDSWGAFTTKFPPPSGCTSPGDVLGVVKKAGGTWRLVPMANAASCKDVRAALKGAGAPPSVLRDFLKGFFTC